MYYVDSTVVCTTMVLRKRRPDGSADSGGDRRREGASYTSAKGLAQIARRKCTNKDGRKVIFSSLALLGHSQVPARGLLAHIYRVR